MKPGIIVLSDKKADIFEWMSDGWNDTTVRHTPEAIALFNKAKKCIGDGEDPADVVKLLEEAGFEIIYDDGTRKAMAKDAGLF